MTLRRTSLSLALGLGVSLALAGCPIESCFDDPTQVDLESDATTGFAPLSVDFDADARGRICGCCGGDPPRQIVDYAWDLDGDGETDVSGEAETAVTVTFDEPGEHTVAVTVTDDSGGTATSERVITVLAADATDQERLDAVDVQLDWDVAATACLREYCFVVQSDFPLEVDRVRFAADGESTAEPVVEDEAPWTVDAEARRFCRTYGAHETGSMELTMQLGEGSRVVTEDVRDASGLCPEDR